MNWKRKMLALASAALLVTGLSASAGATVSDSDTLSVTLQGGVITGTITVNTDLSPATFNHATGYSDATGGAFTVTVMDDRNTADGYLLNLAASNFTGTSGGTIVLKEDAKLTIPSAGTVTTQAGDSVSLPTANTVGGLGLSTDAATILMATNGAGNGHYTAAGYTLALDIIDPTIPPGTYQSTLTLTSPAAP